MAGYKNLNGCRVGGSSDGTRVTLDHRNMTPDRWRVRTSITALTAVVFLLLAQSGLVIAQTLQPDQQSLQSAGEIEKMIDGLGSDDFLLRQRSSEQLLEAGSAAIPQLNAARNSLDQEIRYRATDILKDLLETELDKQAKRFLTMPLTASDDCGFQHWPTFSQLAGTSREARSLLVAIHSNPQSKRLLRGIDLDLNTSAKSAVAAKTTPFDNQSVPISLPVYAAEMYRRSMQPQTTDANRKKLLAGSAVIAELSASAFESNFLSLSPIRVQQNEHKPAFLTLLTAWLKFELQSTPLTVAKLKIISTYRLRAFADELVEVLNRPHYPHKQAAIESLGNIFSPTAEDNQSTLENHSGVVDAISQLSPFVLSNEVLVRLPQTETKGPVEVTLGDFAFQLMLNIQEKSPKDFGMSEASGRMILDNKPVFCFKSREAASKSIQKWLANLDESQSNINQ